MEHKGYITVLNGVKNNLKTYQDQEFTEDLGLNTHEWRYRVSDPAIGRFWQIDPLAEKYVHNGVYNFSENRVIDAWELEGLEAHPMSSPATASATINDIRSGPNKEEYEIIGGVFFVGGLAAFVGVVTLGAEATVALIGNEFKDELLSQATGGASDVLDLTKGLTKLGKNIFKKYSGNIVKVNQIDEAADKLADKLGGQSSVKFDTDINSNREFDVISDEFIGQTKQINGIGSKFRNQAKATFEAAKATDRKVYYQLNSDTSKDVINKINEYSKRYEVEAVIEYLD